MALLVHETLPIRALLIDDSKIFLNGLSAQLQRFWPNMSCVLFDNSREAMSYFKTHEVDLVFLDMRMPDVDGLECFEQMKRLQPDLKCVVLSDHLQLKYIEPLMASNLDAYLLKSIPPIELKQAVEFVLAGEPYIDESILTLWYEYINNPKHLQLDLLSNREMETMHLLVLGFGTDQIAQKLGLAESTIHSYRKQVYRKLKVQTLSGLIQYAHEINWRNYP